jgi:hypothetical protein
VWKLVIKHSLTIKTPFTETLVNDGWFKADQLDFQPGHKFEEEAEITHAIHCYEDINTAIKQNHYLINCSEIKCYALKKDFIAAGKQDDLVFSKIWIPTSELERIKNETINIRRC